MTPNQKAFLDMIAISEIGQGLLDVSDNGYNVIVGSTPSHPILFNDYSTHPRKLIDLGNGLKSTAAGRYQLLARYYEPYRLQLGLPDFSPDSQDAIALQQIRECKAIGNIDTGRFHIAVAQCARIWASLPGAGYGQHENSMEKLEAAYITAGGTLA